MTVRPQTPADGPAVRALLLAAFGQVRVADLAEALLAADHGAALVAELDGAVVGHVQLSRSWVDAPDRLVPALVLSPLGVLPAAHGRGVGGLLVRAALTEAQRRDAPLVFLEGDPAYYARFGFVAAGPRGFTAPSVRIPAPAFQVVILPAWEPSMTGALVYADAFWAADCVGLR